MACVAGGANTWNCAASASVLADVNNLQAGSPAGFARGDTVNITGGGNFTVTTAGVLSKGMKLLGPGRDTLTLAKAWAAGTSTIINISPDATALANEEIIKVDGFTFDGLLGAGFVSGGSNTTYIINIDGAGRGAAKPFKNLVFTNNRVTNSSPISGGQGALHVNDQARGVIAGNIFDRCNVVLKIIGINVVPGVYDNPAYYPVGNTSCWQALTTNCWYGISDQLFFEDNTMIWSSAYTGDDPGWTESGQDARLVQRYNTFNLANASGQNEFWDIHGFQGWPKANGGGNTGTMVTEYYGNTWEGLTGERLLNWRGGWLLFYNNLWNAGGSIQHNDYGPSDTGGSGCNGDIAGSGTPPTPAGNYDAEIRNGMIFNNLKAGVAIDMHTNDTSIIGCAGQAEDVTWRNYKATCTSVACASGIGRGTTVPTGTCTVGTAYWVASSPTPQTTTDTVVVSGITTHPLSSAAKTILQSGTLYQCSNANVWSPYYNPYTYPHPLRDLTPPPPPPPPSPTDSTVVARGRWLSHFIGGVWALWHTFCASLKEVSHGRSV